MSESQVPRRLAAIVIADVAGYSRMMERPMEADEPGTFNRFRVFRADIVEPATLRYRGRVGKSTGDGSFGAGLGSGSASSQGPDTRLIEPESTT